MSGLSYFALITTLECDVDAGRAEMNTLTGVMVDDEFFVFHVESNLKIKGLGTKPSPYYHP